MLLIRVANAISGVEHRPSMKVEAKAATYLGFIKAFESSLLSRIGAIAGMRLQEAGVEETSIGGQGAGLGRSFGARPGRKQPPTDENSCSNCGEKDVKGWGRQHPVASFHDGSERRHCCYSLQMRLMRIDSGTRTLMPPHRPRQCNKDRKEN